MSETKNDPGIPADNHAMESPLQKALRLKKASAHARSAMPGREHPHREQAARMATGKSKPWMSR